MKKLYLLAVVMLLSYVSAFSQRMCGTMEQHQHLLESDPLYEQRRQEIEQFTQQWLAEHPGEDRVLVTIPVVVHVVYNTTAENISDAQIQSQIDVLNADFRKLNSDISLLPSVWTSTAADVNIEFCLATVDPTGAPTNGVVRKSTTVTSFGTNDSVKFNTSGGSNAWPSSSYLNIWVCDISSGILGYAQFPGGSASTDGVVCDYLYFGTIGTATAPFNKGRTATHEVGHWLNLYHIWGDDGSGCTGSDQVADTPNAADPNYGCPAFPTVSCSNGPNGDMFMNYMDYTDDACMYMFTNGQASRSQALFATGGFRASLLTSNGCGVPSGCATAGGQTTSSVGNNSATASWTGVSGAASYNVRYKATSATTWTTVNTTGTSAAISGLAVCTAYEWQVQTVCTDGGTSNFSGSATFTTTGCTVTCNNNYEDNDNINQTYAIALNTNYNSYICPADDQDWYSRANSTSKRHIRITLTSLPGDYDIYLYNPSGVLVASSENGGITNETIVYNNGPVGTYKIQIVGYGGAFSGSDSYILKMTTKSTPYRLDGTDEEESLIEVMNVFPNPTEDKANIVFMSDSEKDIFIAVYDMMGKIVFEKRFTCEAGENTTSVNLQDCSRGCYQAVMYDGEQSATVRICKE